MSERDLDRVLAEALRGRDVEPQLVDRIAGNLADSTLPTRPLASRTRLAGGLLGGSAALAIAAAALLGIRGFPLLSPVQIAAIFPTLAVLACLTALVLVGQMTPGSPRLLSPRWLPAGGSLVLAALFAALFNDYRTVRFVPAGLACLTAGVAVAIPAGAAAWLWIRRGFFLNPVSAGMAAGALAGLAGVTMLEIHCPNFEVLHVLVWHTAVLPVSSALGAGVAWAAGHRSRKP